MRLERDLAENILAKVVNMKLPLDEIFHEINRLLSEHGVMDDVYALNQPDIDDKYCLHLEEGLWVAYYSERGGRHGLCIFCNYHDAVRYFIWNLLRNILPDIQWEKINIYG
ncbi:MULTISPECIES: hypothetical protein [Photorhabdus]|uniref:Uncharacterized protein n=2 Tax=Photorhabdus TaxID=29487 RepID=A0A1G5R9Z6_PHOLU|nr:MULTISPECIES: hypothetical protein [Photorhabdus]KMW72084.1 hypothetical protein TI10_15950 [Photorhabdus luminescens subsp. luminescens]MQL48213.1 hypothetical protein [Photorhabdus khanii]OWO79723.1 hypothetical protein B5C26_19560 [Photorhabdus luminescens]SCZ70668.1 hypothetical protein SAMN02982990_03559 [Photorhabdus luminescens]